MAELDQQVAENETTLVMSDWRFTGTGWITEGDTVLAAEASAKAREYAKAKRSARSCTVSGATEMEETCGTAC